MLEDNIGCGLSRAKCCYFGRTISDHHCTSPMEHRFTRQELHDRIWSTPMTRVAAELGTTPSRLSSLVRHAGIPTPPAGYWIKREFGKAEPQPPLPPAPLDCPEPLVLDTDADTVRARRPETTPRNAEPAAQLPNLRRHPHRPLRRPHPHQRLALLSRRQSLGKPSMLLCGKRPCRG